MACFPNRTTLLAAALAATVAAPIGALPALAQDGVDITIRKGPSYLNTRTTPNPGSATLAARNTSAATQPFYAQRNSISFSRYPLPSTFDVPGF